MRVEFTLQERLALYGMLVDQSTDIILKTDREGYVVSASRGLEQLGYVLPSTLIGPHLRDLVLPEYCEFIKERHRAVIAGAESNDWFELPTADNQRRAQWFETQISPMRDVHGRINGTLVVMRSIARRRSLEERLFAAEFTDPLTHLTNRIAFVAMLDHLVAHDKSASLALFDIDHFMNFNMRYGQGAGDDLLRAFAELLQSMTRSEDIISRVGGERFGVIMPGMTPNLAEASCMPIVEALAQVGGAAPNECFPVSTSVGIAAISSSTDNTVKNAELALFIAKAKGRSRIEIKPTASATPFPTRSGSPELLQSWPDTVVSKQAQPAAQ